MDETHLFKYVCPDRHYLESWGIKASFNKVSFIQPTIQPLFDSRQFQDSVILVRYTISYYDYLKEYWSSKISWSSSYMMVLLN